MIPSYDELRRQGAKIVEILLNTIPWKCHRCGTVNHVLNKRCTFCWEREGLTIKRSE